MSKIGQQPITVPDQIKVQIQDHQIQLSGPLGQLTFPIPKGIKVAHDPKTQLIQVTRQSDHRRVKSFHGLTRTLIANAIQGITQGWSKSLELVGTGYRVALEGQNLNLKIGFSHPVIIKPPEGIKLEVEGNNIIHVKGFDKILVGQIAAQIRSVRKPEPYKGKGIRYQGEIVRRKPGKAAKTAA
jgi:large subunit ribosomal protein L6